MAVDPRIKSFYKRHHMISVVIVAIFQIINVAVLAGALIIAEIVDYDSPTLWALLLLVFVTGFSMSIIALGIIIEPVRAIATALSYVAGEKSHDKPPNPNLPRYAKDGTKAMLDLIYKLTYAHDNVAPHQPETPDTASEQLNAALAQTDSSVIIFNPEGEITYASARAPVRANPKGNLFLDLMFDSSDITFEYWLRDCAKDKIDNQKTWTRIHTDPDSPSKPRIYDIAASYSRGSDTEVVLVIQDRTEQYLPDEKDLDFIAFAAHELRGPITVIRGYLDVFDDELTDVLTAEQQILLGRLVVSANRLSTYINNILNVSRYDKKHYQITLTEQRLFDIYDSIEHDMKTRASTLGRILAVDIPHDLPTVAADINSLTEVLANLIDNAIKYSNEGGAIHIKAGVVGDFVEVSVHDNGIGMPDSVVRNLFHKFYRSHRSREQVAGSGIGLYISKAIVESHGGTISVRSSEDKGSTFTFSLPIYSTVEQKLKASDNGNNKAMINSSQAWISNHNMYRG